MGTALKESLWLAAFECLQSRSQELEAAPVVVQRRRARPSFAGQQRELRNLAGHAQTHNRERAALERACGGRSNDVLD